jgi:signal transduction histidine kinase
VDGRSFWESVVTAMMPAAAMRNVRLETDPSQYPAEKIKVDALQVKKVLLNLISNALKYTPAGGKVRVNIQALNPPVKGCTRRITVQDTGIGMSQEFMERMFEPFAQEHRAEAQKRGRYRSGAGHCQTYRGFDGRFYHCPE